jgi:hypothetical protein
MYYKKDLYGMIERTYQKEESLVRKEWKISKPMSINKFEEALQKGLARMDSAQSVCELKKEVRVVGEALKFNNSWVLDAETLADLRSCQDCKETPAVLLTAKKVPCCKLHWEKLADGVDVVSVELEVPKVEN